MIASAVQQFLDHAVEVLDSLARHMDVSTAVTQEMGTMATSTRRSPKPVASPPVCLCSRCFDAPDRRARDVAYEDTEIVSHSPTRRGCQLSVDMAHLGALPQDTTGSRVLGVLCFLRPHSIVVAGIPSGFVPATAAAQPHDQEMANGAKEHEQSPDPETAADRAFATPTRTRGATHPRTIQIRCLRFIRSSILPCRRYAGPDLVSVSRLAGSWHAALRLSSTSPGT